MSNVADSYKYLRGAAFYREQEAKVLAEDNMRANHRGDAGLLWGNCRIPTSEARKSFFVVGMTGSGKTITIKHLMGQVLPQITTGKRWRAVIADPKGDFYRYLRHLDLSCPIHVLNPFDSRTSWWDVAADAANQDYTQTIAATFLPETSKESFFTYTPRILLQGLMDSLQAHPSSRGAWTLRDLISAARNNDDLKSIYERSPELTHHLIQEIDERNSSRDSLTTLRMQLSKLASAAAGFERAKALGSPRLSLDEWVREGESVLLLGFDPLRFESIMPINAVIIERIAHGCMDLPEGEEFYTWFFLDELANIGHLRVLRRLLSFGRSKGSCAVLGTQTLEDLYAAAHNDTNSVDAMVANIGNKAIFRTDSTKSAEWASRVLGHSEYESVSESVTYSRDSTSRTWQRGGVVDRPLVHQDEIKSLPFPDVGPKAMWRTKGFYRSSALDGAWEATLPIEHWPPHSEQISCDEPNRSPWPEALPFLNWTDTDRERLGFFEDGRRKAFQ